LVAATKFLVAATKKLLVPYFVAITKPFISVTAASLSTKILRVVASNMGGFFRAKKSTEVSLCTLQ